MRIASRIAICLLARALLAQAPTIDAQLKKDTVALEARLIVILKATPADPGSAYKIGHQIIANMLKMQAQCTDAYLVKPVGTPGGSGRDYLCAAKP